jgi:GntR family transcriptional regulator
VVVPFKVAFEPGIPLHEQVAYASRKAIISGQMRVGDPFPSVRALSKELKINPNTAHKVVTQLLNEGLIEVRAGVGTLVARLPRSTAAERSRLLRGDIEKLVVEARLLSLGLDDVLEAVASHWERFDNRQSEAIPGKGGRERP